MSVRTRKLLIAALRCAAGVAVLALLFYGLDWFNSLDLRLTTKLTAPEGSITESLFHGLADLANPVPLALALGGIVTVGLLSGRYRQLLIATVAFFGANLSTQLMKAALAHPRLQTALGAAHPIEVGYPSGHTTAALSAGFALWLVAAPRYRRVAARVGIIYGILVGTGVVVAGWHFLTDVAGAILVVGFWVCLALIAAGSETDSIERPGHPPSLGTTGVRMR